MLKIQRSTCDYSTACRKAPIYGLLVATHCEQHRLSTHVNLVERLCVSCGLLDVLGDTDKCYACGHSPDQLKRRRLVKQRAVQGWLDNNGFDDYILTDRQVSVPERGAGCTTPERPDFLFDEVTHFVILEVDEGGHKGYILGCDDIRMRNLGEDIMRRGVFIRYNPDAYTAADGSRQNPSWSVRMETLRRWLTFAMVPENVPDTLQVVHLFFDGYDPTMSSFTTLRATEA